MTDEAVSRMFSQLHEMWIQPELSKRFGGTVPPDFCIYSYLVRLPRDAAPIVEFNHEIGWFATCEKPQGISFEAGEPIHLYQVKKVLRVKCPAIDNERVPYVYFCKMPTRGYRIAFDFAASGPVGEGDWDNSDLVCTYLNATFIERTVQELSPHLPQFAAMGLWPVPSLIPYPMALAIQKTVEGKADDAKKAIFDYCSMEWLRTRRAIWGASPSFARRSRLIDQLFGAYEREEWELVVHTAVPQFEGLITEWMHSTFPHETIPHRTESRLKKFGDLFATGNTASYAYKQIASALVAFCVNGPVLSGFKAWQDQPSMEFPNRHLLGHGKYDPAAATRENALKAMLMLDSIASLIQISEQSEVAGGDKASPFTTHPHPSK